MTLSIIMDYLREKLFKILKNPTETEDDMVLIVEENPQENSPVCLRKNSERRSDRRPEESSSRNSYDFMKHATSVQIFTYLKDNKLPFEDRESSPTREKRLEYWRQATSAEVYARLNKGFRPKYQNE